MPPLPKDPAVRRRRNKSSTRSMLRPIDPKDVVVPPLPQLDDWEWHPLTVAEWNRIWGSPMATEWDRRGDLGATYVYITLFDRFWETPTPTLPAEIRQQQDKLGITPVARRRLEWTIERVEEAKAEGRRRAASPPPRGKADPRRALAVVK